MNPYRIIYWKNKWYLIGFCHLRDDVRTFRVDRISSLTATEETFEQLEHISIDSYFPGNLLPIMENEGVTTNLVISGDVNTLEEVCHHWFLGHYLKEKHSTEQNFNLKKILCINTYHKYYCHMVKEYKF